MALTFIVITDKDMLVFRDHPNQCIGLFDTAVIAIAIKCICTA